MDKLIQSEKFVPVVAGNAEAGRVRQNVLHHLSRKQVGLLAQDVEQVLSELVDTDEAGYKTLRYDLVTALLVEAVKELSERVEALAERTIK